MFKREPTKNSKLQHRKRTKWTGTLLSVVHVPGQGQLALAHHCHERGQRRKILDDPPAHDHLGLPSHGRDARVPVLDETTTNDYYSSAYVMLPSVEWLGMRETRPLAVFGTVNESAA